LLRFDKFGSASLPHDTHTQKLRFREIRGGGGGGGIDVVKNKKTYNQIYHSCKEV